MTWKTSNTAVATVDTNGKVTAVGPGTVTITATAKDGSGKSASCSVTVIQPVTGITLNKTSTSIKVGGSETLTATVSPGNASNKAVTWKSANTAVATVDANGKVTAVATGTVTITATAKDGSGKSASCEVTVFRPVTGITLNKTSLSLKTGATETLTVTVSPSNATNKAVTWKTSNTAVATVDANGKVTAVGPGTATITATAKDGSGKSASCSVSVTQPVTGITLSKTSVSIKVGGSEALTVTISPSNASNKAVTWKSSNAAVATVDANGKVTAVAPGTATITVTAKDGSGKSASCNVTVIQPVTGIVLSETSLSMKTGEMVTLTATVSPGNASNKNVEFTSSDQSVAVIEVGKRVRAVGPGTATITATAVDGSGVSATCSVTVVRLVSGVSLNKNTLSLHTGKSETLTATVYPADATIKGVTWESSNTKVATVDANGKVTGVGPGTAIITAITKDVTGVRDSCEVTVICPVTDVILNKNSVELVTGENETLTVTVKPDNASNKAVTWASSDTTVATVDSNGKITAVGAGTATITATAKDGSGKSASCIVKVMSERERQVRAFVERMYTVALGRASESSGINYWTEELLSHRKDGASISEGFIMSEEFVAKNYSNEEYLKVLYRTFFDREADTGGMSFWLGQMSAGRSRKSVLAGFVNSKEFTDICAAYGIDRGTMEDDATATGAGQFVERLYSIALERPSDPAGLKDWADRINNRTNTPEQVAKEFFLSPEYTAKNTSNDKYVETLYLVFMGRASESTGKAYWVEQLNNGMSREAVLEGFAQSEEFKEIMARYGL